MKLILSILSILFVMWIIWMLALLVLMFTGWLDWICGKLESNPETIHHTTPPPTQMPIHGVTNSEAQSGEVKL